MNVFKWLNIGIETFVSRAVLIVLGRIGYVRGRRGEQCLSARARLSQRRVRHQYVRARLHRIRSFGYVNYSGF